MVTVPRPRSRGLLAFLCLLGVLCPLVALAQPAKEYQIKAVFLFNFTQFVEWPSDVFPDPRTPLVIGVLGSDPFGPLLDESITGETANGRPLIVERYRRPEDIKTCHVLFIGRSETTRLDQIFSTLKGRSILTVGEAEGFAQHGGMIRFVPENGKIRMRINVEAAREARLAISSKLLRSAMPVVPGKD